MKYYRVHDLQGYNFMDDSWTNPLTALQIRSRRWTDYRDNMSDIDHPMSWNDFTLAFIADVWELAFEQVVPGVERLMPQESK